MPTLDWIGKKAVVKHHKDVPYRLLEPVAELTPPAAMYTVQTNGCFFRLLSWMTRAYRSAKTPNNFHEVVKPGKAKSARIDSRRFIAFSYVEK
jgi:hypothetical protein